MSLTCPHTIADAPNHPECRSCRTIPRSESRAAQEAEERLRDWNARDAARRTPWHMIGAPIRTPTTPVALPAVTRQETVTLHMQSSPSADDVAFNTWHAQAGQKPTTFTLQHLYSEGGPPSLLPDRPLTPEERAACDEDPRPGLWAGDREADLRALTQEETDQLIRRELVGLTTTTSDYAEVSRVAGGGGGGVEVRLGEQSRWALSQRGGIDSDPLVRLLAYRAWGDRDRQWFELRGVRKGEAVDCTTIAETDVGVGTPVIARSRMSAPSAGVALEDGRPGQLVRARIDTSRLPIPFGTVVRGAPSGGVATVEVDLQRYDRQLQRGIVDMLCRVSDRPRADPSQPPVRLPRVEAARRHFLALGVPADELWCDIGPEPGTTRLWHAPGGSSATVEERQVLARTWHEGGEQRYEGPEVEDWGESVLRQYEAVQRNIRTNHVSIQAQRGPDDPLRWQHLHMDPAFEPIEFDARNVGVMRPAPVAGTRWDGATAEDILADLRALGDAAGMRSVLHDENSAAPASINASWYAIGRLLDAGREIDRSHAAARVTATSVNPLPASVSAIGIDQQIAPAGEPFGVPQPRVGMAPRSIEVTVPGGDPDVDVPLPPGAEWHPASPLRTGDRVRNGDLAYVVTSIDANHFTLSAAPRDWTSEPATPPPPAGGMRSPAVKPTPPVPPWAKKKRGRAAAQRGAR